VALNRCPDAKVKTGDLRDRLVERILIGDRSGVREEPIRQHGQQPKGAVGLQYIILNVQDPSARSIFPYCTGAIAGESCGAPR
jgi:hypothetical protein